MVEELEQRPREAGRAAGPAAVLRAQLGLLHQPDLGGVLTVLAGADPAAAFLRDRLPPLGCRSMPGI
jgi:hypothetical protein